MKKLEKKQLIVVAFTFTLLLLVGGTYAYFSINASNDKTGAKVTGKANNLGNPTMQIKTSKLYLNLDANLMSQANAGKTYYANEDSSGLALTTNPNYTLATASLPVGDEALDCTYNYKVTATVTTPITDNSDSDVKVIVGEKEMTLKELTAAGTDGIIVSGEIKNLTKGQSVSISLTSSVTNTSSTQDKLVGNSYTINIDPYTSGDTKAFSCNLVSNYQIDTAKTLAQNLIDSEWLWQSGLEGDGYRYVGSGTVGTDTNPDNFICFGTSDKTECTANQDKYMYRVLGVFSDSNGNNHVKLIKYKHIIAYSLPTEYLGSNWGESYYYVGLNGEYFLTNTTYDYFQNGLWKNKMVNWTWKTVDTKSTEDNTNSVDYEKSSPTGIYLNEMHSTLTELLCENYEGSAINCNNGEWSSTSGYVGLMYASDYALSLGSSALELTTGGYPNSELLKTGWMYPGNIDTLIESIDYTISRHNYLMWYIGDSGIKTYQGDPGSSIGIRPTFYLTNDVKITADGDGSLENPFIIQE